LPTQGVDSSLTVVLRMEAEKVVTSGVAVVHREGLVRSLQKSGQVRRRMGDHGADEVGRGDTVRTGGGESLKLAVTQRSGAVAPATRCAPVLGHLLLAHCVAACREEHGGDGGSVVAAARRGVGEERRTEAAQGAFGPR